MLQEFNRCRTERDEPLIHLTKAEGKVEWMRELYFSATENIDLLCDMLQSYVEAINIFFNNGYETTLKTS